VAFACGLSLLLTIPRLTDRSVWTDEALTVGAASQLAETIGATGGTMALYYAAIAPILAITTERFWLRLPSALFVAGAVAVTYMVGRRIGGRSLAVGASLALASTWSLARWGLEARGYGLAMVLVSLSWLATVAAATTTDPHTRRRWLVVLGLATVFAPLAHGLAALQFPVQVVALLVRPDRREWLRRLTPIAAAWAVVGAALLALGAGDVAGWISPLVGDDLLKVFRMLIGRGPFGLVVAALVVVGTARAIAQFARAAPWRTSRPEWTSVQERAWLASVAVAWGWGVPLLVLAISLVRPYQEPRYLVTSLPGIALVLALALEPLRRWWRIGALAVVMAGLLAMQPAATETAGEDWPRVVQLLEAEADPGDGFIIRPLLRAPFDYASEELGHPIALQPLSPTDPIGSPKRFYGEPAGSVRTQLVETDLTRVWVVVRGPEDRAEMELLRDDGPIASRWRVAEMFRLRGEISIYRFIRQTEVS